MFQKIREIYETFKLENFIPHLYFDLLWICCTDTVQMREESEKKCDLRRQQKMDRGGAGWQWQQWRAMEDCSTDERPCRRQFCNNVVDAYFEKPRLGQNTQIRLHSDFLYRRAFRQFSIRIQQICP